MSKRLENLTSATALSSADLIYTVRGGNSRKTTVADLVGGPSVKLVEGISDLPAPVSNERTLVANTVYLVRGVITLPAGEFITLSEGSDLIGRPGTADGFTGDYDGALIGFNVASPTSALRWLNLTVENTSTHASAASFDFRGTGADFISDYCTWKGKVIIGSCSSFAAGDFQVFSSAGGGDGVSVEGTLSFVTLESFAAILTGVGARGVVVKSTGSVTSTFDADSFLVVATDPTQIGLEVEVGGSVTAGSLDRPNFSGTFANYTKGFDQSTPGWNVINSPIIPDSVAGGGSTLTTAPEITTINTINVYEDLGSGAGGFTLDADSERVELVGSSTNGALIFKAKRATKCFVYGGVSATRVGGGSDVYELAIFHKPALGSYSEVAGKSALATVTSAVTHMDILPTFMELAENDEVKLRIRNTGGTTNVQLEAAALVLVAAG